ncbi:UNVERIFIED_CONTAM: hypothetical protein Sradi_5751300 [Sesamum radiatum]|uniref:BED-type domain-containing protein n=1 Tax=Sesamum radiatum TaxID=300843 RepID=A0AAW2L2R0_SESRA
MNSENASHSGGDEGSTHQDARPLWKFVTKLGRIEGGGGNVSFTCNICKGAYKGSYSRVKAHLLKIGGNGIKGCPKVTVSQIVEMTKLEDEAVQRKERGQPKMVSLPLSICSSSQSSSHSVSMDAINSSSFRQERYEPKKRKVGSDSALEKAFNFQVREQLDSEIARMFYSGGLPFNLARNPYYVRAFSFAANNNIAGYVPLITEIAASALMIRNFIMNHSMRLAMFNEFSKLKLLAVAETRFASVIVMLKRFKLIKQQLKMMVISEQWSCYRDDHITHKLLGHVSSSSCCEKNWSTYAFIHSTRRNQITPQRAQDLVFVHNNLRLLSRKTPQYFQGDSKMWDVAGDAFETIEDVGILEIANLSLDEPELETVLFDENTEDSGVDNDNLTHLDD